MSAKKAKGNNIAIKKQKQVFLYQLGNPNVKRNLAQKS